MSRNLAAILLMNLAAACFAVLNVLAKWLGRDYGAPEILFFRYLTMLLILSAIFLPRMGSGLLRTRRPGLQLVTGIMVALSNLTFFIALTMMPIAEAVAIGFVSPLLVVALSAPFLGERVGVGRWIAVLVGFLGMLVIVRPGLAVFNWGSFWVMLMAFAYSFYQISTRVLGASDRPIVTLYWSAVTGLVLSALLLPFVWRPPSTTALALTALMGVTGMVAHFSLIRAFSMAEASLLAPFNYATLVWAALGAFFWFDEVPDLITVLGAAIVAASGLYVAYSQRRPAPPADRS
ncbi:MAG: DMT family transporter [Alphaproteobacteria bacterium]|nr:DMT family transporter [Alphaproteobacteria bacterium]